MGKRMVSIASLVSLLVSITLLWLPSSALAGDPVRYADRKSWPDWAVTYLDYERLYPNDGELADAIRYELIRGYPVAAQDDFGYEDREFRPDREMNRAEFATVLSRSLALAADGDGAQWSAPHIAALRAKGVIPADAGDDWAAAISRREAGQWMGRAADAFKADDAADTRTFSDVNDPLIQRALRAGVVKGTGQGQYAPDRTLLRVEAALMLLRLARAMNSQGNDKNAQVIQTLQNVIKEADRQGAEQGKRWVQVGKVDGVETGGVLTQEFSETIMHHAQVNVATVGVKPRAWTVEVDSEYRFKVLELHDSIAVLQSCGLAQIYRITDPSDKPWFERRYCGRQFMIYHDGHWLLTAAGQEK